MKDGVTLDEMFTFKPEAFNAVPEEEAEGEDKKKGKKKGKKKSTKLEYDEKLGEVVARKTHKRADGVWEEEDSEFPGSAAFPAYALRAGLR